MKLRRFRTVAGILLLCAGLAIAVHAQEIHSQTAALLITDQDAAEKIIAILKNVDPKQYYVDAVLRTPDGKLTRQTFGSLSEPLRNAIMVRRGLKPVKELDQVTSTLQTVISHDTFISSIFAEPVDRIKAVLKGVDNRLYQLDVIATY